jgi:Glycosyl hydrolase catalytic core
MRVNVGIILLASVIMGLVTSCGGEGNANAPASGSPTEGGSSSGSSSSSGGAPAQGPGAATPDASAAEEGSSVQDAGGGAQEADAASSRLDGAGGDGGPLLYKGVANSACADLTTLKVAWWYNWTTNSSGCATPQFVPMVWGHTGSEQTAAGIAGEVSGIVKAGYENVLGFNEPDNTGQSNISVMTAISLWPSFNDPSVRVGSPATQGNSTGLTWIQSFMSQVNADTAGSLRVDFIATHWYGWNAGSCDADAANLESWIKQIEAIPGNRPIWLTEWGCLNQSNPDAATVQAFFSGAIAMFAKHPRLERYAWYPWTTNNELVDSGALTSLGTVFADAPANK